MSNWFTNTIGSAAGDVSYWFSGGSALQSQLTAQDNTLAVLNAKDYAPGGSIYNQISASQGTAAADAAYQQVQQDEASGNVNVQQQELQAAQAGAAAGLDSLSSGIQGVTSGLFSTLFKLIPWQVWLFGGVALFVWLGGLELLKGSLSKRR